MKNQSPTLTFADLVHKYNESTTSKTERDLAIVPLAKAVVFSVLKKINQTASDQTIEKIRRDLVKATASLDRLDYAMENASKLVFNKDGDLATKIIDPDLYKATDRLVSADLGDGLDLVNDAIIAIIDETRKQSERDPEKPTDLERPYTVRRLKRKVWIKTADTVNGWETVETTPIQEIYKAVRRSVSQSRAVRTDPKNGYTYLADLAYDPESNETATVTVYKRLSKYADLGGHVVDFNGKETAYTASETTVNETESLIASLNLTARQMQVLSLRMSGHGYKAIATYLGVTQRAIAKTVAQIQAKATACGLTVNK